MGQKLKAGRNLAQEINENIHSEDVDTSEDAYAKKLFKYKKVLAVILQLEVSEFKGCTLQEVVSYISEISDTSEVSEGIVPREVVRQENSESTVGAEKRTYFDILFEVGIPKTEEKRIFRLIVDLEIQKTLKLPYPIENRGIYYLARKISDQLNYVYEDTAEYRQLKKVVTIWICLNDIPSALRNSVVKYRMQPVEVKGIADRKRVPSCDLMEMIVIRLGETVFDEDEEVIKYLYGAFEYQKYPEYFEKYISPEAIDSETGLREELIGMSGIATFNFNSGEAEGIHQGIQQGADILLEAVQRLRNGESEDDLREVYDEEMIKKALLKK